MEHGQIRCLDMRFFDIHIGPIFVWIFFLHLAASFLFLIAGFLMDFFGGDGPGGFLFFLLVSIVNFSGGKTVSFLFGGSLKVFVFYVFSIFTTSFYLWLLIRFVCYFRRKKI